MKFKTLVFLGSTCLALGLAGEPLRAQPATGARQGEVKPAVTNLSGDRVNLGAVLDASDSYRPVPLDRFLFRIIEDPAKGGEEEIPVTGLNELKFKITQGANETVTISTKGKTLTEIKKELKKFLDDNYYQNATIYLRLKDQSVRPGLVVIMGSIKQNIQLHPGNPKTVYQALLEVGVNDYVNLKKVKLWRLNPATNKEEPTVIDIQSMLKGGSREKDIILQDGDRIEVTDKTFFLGI